MRLITKVLLLVGAAGSSLLAADFDITGTVADSAHRPIPNATVALKASGLTAYTDSAGAFGLYRATSSMAGRRRALPGFAGARLAGQEAQFAVPKARAETQRVVVEVFSPDGRRMSTIANEFLAPGVYAVSPLVTTGLKSRRGVAVVNVRVGDATFSWTVTGLTNNQKPLGIRRIGNLSAPAASTMVAAAAAFPDSIIVSKFSFVTRRIVTVNSAANAGEIILFRDGYERKIDSLLALMTLDEKVGQMVQAERTNLTSDDEVRSLFMGSLLSGGCMGPAPRSPQAWADMIDGLQEKALGTRLKIPLIYATDLVHGNANVRNGVIFPHNIGMGCTRNAALVEEEGKVCAAEAAACGIHWTFAPCIAVPRDERWGRTYEGFGETPELAVDLGAASIRGLQGGTDWSKVPRIAACAKHFVADGGTSPGTSSEAVLDEGDAQIDETTLRSIHLPGYIAAVRDNVASIMMSYSYWNGTNMHAHTYLVTDVLKTRLGFEGLVISDYNGFNKIPATGADAFRFRIKTAVNAGMDMGMCPDTYKEFITTVKSLVTSNEISIDRINDAVRRILRVKYHLGLFDRPKSDRTLLAQVGIASHRTAARAAVAQSLVVLKNLNSVLPLKKTGQRIVVVGQHANSLALQCGGWSLGWQSMDTVKTAGTTVLGAIKQAVADSSQVTYSADGTNLAAASIAVVVLGEISYAEWWGDVGWQGYGGTPPIPNLSIPAASRAILDRVKAANIPILAVLLSGRPLVLGADIDKCDCFVAAWWPGTEGGGIADVLFGDVAPSGRSSHSWPRTGSQVPINIGDPGYDPLFPYGYGL